MDINKVPDDRRLAILILALLKMKFHNDVIKSN